MMQRHKAHACGVFGVFVLKGWLAIALWNKSNGSYVIVRAQGVCQELLPDGRVYIIHD